MLTAASITPATIATTVVDHHHSGSSHGAHLRAAPLTSASADWAADHNGHDVVDDDDDDVDTPPSPLLSGSRSPLLSPCTTPGTVLDVAIANERDDSAGEDSLPLPPLGTFKPKFTRNGPRPRHHSAPYPVRGTFLPVATGQSPMPMPLAVNKFRCAQPREMRVNASADDEPRHNGSANALSDRSLTLRTSDVCMSAEDIEAARVLAGIQSAPSSPADPTVTSATNSVPLAATTTRRASIHVSPPTSTYSSYATTLAAAMSMYPPPMYTSGYPLSPTFMFSPWSYMPYSPSIAAAAAPPSPPLSSTSGSPPPPPPPPPPPSDASMLDEVVQLAQTVGADESDDMVTRTLDRMRRQVEMRGMRSRKQFDADYAWLKKYLAIRLFTSGSRSNGGQVPGKSADAGGTVAGPGTEKASLAAVQEAVKLATGGMQHAGPVMGSFGVGGGLPAQRS
ncbi:hypothetical protein BCR44DRAFT_45041 [Catenaria anguillulae PL171]|uniref:Uncharacterized protein n=1 Tax=Catenaria anguillulae PL171 TaxID=765915 RepID=A0A1Y2HQM1_9FUNG|nr:hypothetical protein BCR44DRAFT_45041 [Catenaria anguillulae PL171]